MLKEERRRKLREGRGPLRRKFLFGFALLFSVAVFGFYGYMSHLLKQHTQAAILDEMKRLQSFVYDHIEYYSALNDVRPKSASGYPEALIRGLSLNGSVRTAYYAADGTFRAESLPMDGGYVLVQTKPSPALQHSAAADLAAAAQNQSVVSLRHDNEKSMAVLTLPLYVLDETAGFLRLTADYSETFRRDTIVLRSLVGFLLALWTLLVGLAWSFARRLTRPLSELAVAMRQFGEGRFGSLRVSSANNEIAVLTNSFMEMREKLEEQMEALKTERNKVVVLESNRRDFFRNVTHELKTPLTTISGYAQILQASDFDDAEFRQNAACRIHRESQRLHRMMLDIIEHSRREFDTAGRRDDVVSLQESFADATEAMRLKAQEREQRIHCRLESLSVNGDADELRKVWDNLLDNAIKYGKLGSVIEAELSSDGVEAVLTVVNEIDPRHRFEADIAFEPFYRSGSAYSREQGSVGLGLAICKRIVELHCGSIELSLSPSAVVLAVRLPLRIQVGNNSA
ncbi:sensor histidine kinase [Cohnella cellulosilytica]|uniref:histidine kinase n=1 Tax=Cohnella cellulosilytica TaxID=986710 RepID=A0ABW2F413_9BACL